MFNDNIFCLKDILYIRNKLINLLSDVNLNISNEFIQTRLKNVYVKMSDNPSHELNKLYIINRTIIDILHQINSEFQDIKQYNINNYNYLNVYPTIRCYDPTIIKESKKNSKLYFYSTYK